MSTQLLKNTKGMITNAILITVSSAAVLIFAMQITSDGQNSQKQLHILRVKQAMAAVEGRVRALALSPTSYTGCNSAIGVSTCQVDMSKFSGILLNRLYSSECEPDVPCGVEIRNIGFQIPTKTFQADIEYTGKEISLKKIEIRLTVPVDILQSQIFNCSDLTGGNQPLFMGFDSTGRPICRGFTTCQAGNFVSGVDPLTVQPECESLPDMKTCPDGKIFSRFNWEGGSKVTYECIDRKNPYDVWPMTSLEPMPKDPPPPVPEGDCAPTSYTWYKGLNVCSGKMASDQYAFVGQAVRVYTTPGSGNQGYFDAFCQPNGSWSASIAGLGTKGEIVCAP